VTQIFTFLHLPEREYSKGRKPTLTNSEAVTVAILKQQLNVVTKKSLFEILEPPCTYNAFVRAINASAKAISQKEYPSSQCRSRTDQNIPLGQLRMAFQAALDRLHGFFAKRNALLIYLAAQLHERMDTFPRPTLGPFQHGLDIDELRPIPV